MTKIKEKNLPADVQSHIEQAYKLIDEHLPARYVSKVQEKLGKNPVSSGVIRNLRNRVNPNPQNNLAVLNALVEVAKDFADEKKLLKQSIN